VRKRGDHDLEHLAAVPLSGIINLVDMARLEFCKYVLTDVDAELVTLAEKLRRM
jgi:hypothetical protein